MSFLNDVKKCMYDSRKYFFYVTLLFILMSAIGFAIGPYLSFLDDSLKEIIEKASDLYGLELVFFIFLNNLISALLGFFLGIFLGIFSALNAVLNGLVLGYVLRKVYDLTGVLEFWKIAPHGIFEIPALVIALGLGIRLGMFPFTKKPGKELSERFFSGLKTFVAVVIPLFLIAAIIEGILITYIG